METGKSNRPRLVLAATLVALALSSAACFSTGGDSYADFRSAVRSGASCAELFDQRSNFSDRPTLEKIDEDLEEIGCEERGSERSDG